MIDSQSIIDQLLSRTMGERDAANENDPLIGYFQSFRPDGRAIESAFEELGEDNRSLFDSPAVGSQLDERLTQLYQVAGDNRRPQGGRDAYFIVRNPAPIDPENAETLAKQWVSNIAEFAQTVGDSETSLRLQSIPKIRVLEGLPPKHPKQVHEKTNLLQTFQDDVPLLVERIDVGPVAPLLRTAYYFIACDSVLRDYLMWPIYSTAVNLADPMEPYFQLWRHGVKYRIFQETQIDLYLPRSST